jgi:hypothetical protein
MKWLVTGVALASLIATPALASRQHLNSDDYWNVTPVAQIFPPSDTWNDVQPRLYVGSTMRHWPSRRLPGYSKQSMQMRPDYQSDQTLGLGGKDRLTPFLAPPK